VLRQHRNRFVLSVVLAIIAVSYSEKWQVQFFTPLRDFLVVPDRNITQDDGDAVPEGFPVKASRDGYYLNPWQLASMVSPLADQVLEENCDILSVSDRSDLLEMANYFMDSVELRSSIEHGNFAVWPYPISSSYGTKPGWISGMVQARVAVLLASAARCTEGAEKIDFDALSRLAVTSLEVSVNDGGVLVSVPGGIWYEEYSQPSVRPPLVLNGHIYAVVALQKLRELDGKADALYRSGVAALLENIHYYSAVTWSYYDRLGTPANNIYQQRLHARQMWEMYELTGEGTFERYLRLFRLQRWSPFSALQRFVMRPSRFLGFLIVVNAIAFFVTITATGGLARRAKGRRWA